MFRSECHGQQIHLSDFRRRGEDSQRNLWAVSTLLTPPILFFVLGMLAAAFRTGLRIPHPIPKLLSLYLLFAIGFKGGLSIAAAGPSRELFATLAAGVGLSTIIPLGVFLMLRTRLGVLNAAAVAATYGSISAVTFITASAVLSEMGIKQSGYMVAVMAVMESPAIVASLMLLRLSAGAEESESGPRTSWARLLHESFLNGPVFLLLGSMAVGALAGEKGAALLKPFAQDMFVGALCFFLLDLGLLAAKRLREIGRTGWVCVLFAMLAPVVQGTLGLVVARFLGMSAGDAFLLTLLAGSASYIAAPAALKLAIPRANPGLYVTMALGVTFPLNIAVGIPAWLALIRLWWAA